MRVTHAVTVLAALMSASALAVTVDLGTKEQAAALFSFPNCELSQHDSCPVGQSLEETVSHFVRQSLTRDQLDLEHSVSLTNGRYQLHFNGSGAQHYANAYQQFLAIGQQAVDASEQLQQAGVWADNWRLFLPLGFAMVNQKSIQLLHFPPDTALYPMRDYLTAATTKRWARMLAYNGVEDSGPYQVIVDISPVAAPANAGSALEPTFAAFTPYAQNLLTSWADRPMPIVAFGAPVRGWLKENYGLSLSVLQQSTIDLGALSQPILASNHPSYLWYAINPANYKVDCHNDVDCMEQRAQEAGIKVTQEDLTAACWQASMANNADGSVLAACKQQWPKDKACWVFRQELTADPRNKLPLPDCPVDVVVDVVIEG